VKHLAIIQTEFFKQARKWNDLTIDEQRRYLKRHPDSKRRLTAKPRSEVKSRNLDTVRGIRRLYSRVRKLDRLSTKAEKANVDLNRNKVYWKIESAINEGEMPHGNDPYNLNVGYTRNEEKNKRITKRLNRLVGRISDAVDTVLDRYVQGVRAYSEPKKQLKEDMLKYIKANYLLEHKIKAPAKVEDLKRKLKAELKTKVLKTKKTPDYISIGHRVKLSNGVEITITDIKHGHKWTTIYGSTDEGVHWHSKQHSSSYSGGNVKYLGKTSEKDVQKHVKNSDDFYSTLRTEDRKREQEGQDVIEKLDIQPGNKIRIRGSDYNWTATVMSVERHKGGVRIDQQRTRRQRRMGPFGFQQMVPGKTHYRFIPARYIIGLAGKSD